MQRQVKFEHSRTWQAMFSLLFVLGFNTPVGWTATPGWKATEAYGHERLSLLDYPGAESAFRQALKEVKLTGTVNDQVLCLQSLAAVLQLQDQTEEALRLYKRSLHLLQHKYGRHNTQLRSTLITLGEIFEAEGEYRRACTFYGQALTITKSQSNPSRFELASCRHHLGHALYMSGYPAKAEALYRASLHALMQDSQLPSSQLLETLLADYIQLLSKAPELRKVLSSNWQTELLKDDLGSLKHTMAVAPSAWQLAVSSRLSGKPNLQASPENRISPPSTPAGQKLPLITPDKPPADFAALEQLNQQRLDFYQRMIAVDIKSLGPNHPSVARDLGGLASIYLLQKNYAQAQELLIKAREIYQTSYGHDSVLVKRTQELLDLISQEQLLPPINNQEKQNYLESMPSIPLAAQKLEIALRLNYLAFLYYSQGKFAAAAQIYNWALADTAAATGKNSLLVAACLNDYGNVLSNCGQNAQSQQMQEDAQRIIRQELVKQRAAAYP